MALTPGERIELIKRAGKALGAQSWTDLSLTLDTFEIPDHSNFDDTWDDNYAYVLFRLRSASDDELIGIHSHLFPRAPAELSTGATGPWKESHFRLFLSHTTANKQLAGEISSHLDGFGVHAFVAHEVIEPTKEWMDEITVALATCDTLAALLTEDFVASKWCDQEIGFAVGRGILIVAVRQGADPHGFISKYQAVPGDASARASSQIASGIYSALLANDLTKAKMAPAMAYRYAGSTSFDDARANLERLKSIPKDQWTDEMVALTDDAGRANSQLAQGVWLGEKIPRVLERHLDELLGRKPDSIAARFQVELEKDPGFQDGIPF